MSAMFRHGVTGAGTTIAVIAPYLLPSLGHDLAVYSAYQQIPAPSLDVYADGHPPEASARNGDSASWALEVTADLELAHLMAPCARLVDVAIPPAPGLTTEATAMEALSALATQPGLRPDVVSFSWGISEPAFQLPGLGRPALASLRRGLTAAARAHITVIAGSGDSGPAVATGGSCTAFTRFRAVTWPTSDPLVTAVGATRLHLTRAGARQLPDTVDGNNGRDEATGAGLSTLYPRPRWQDQAGAIAGTHQGVVDAAMPGSAQVYIHLVPRTCSNHARPGWNTVGGTSVSAPLFAGVVADAAQAAGHRLGVLGPALYQLHGPADGVLDVVHGSNTLPGVPGYAAGPGYDLPSGIGTVGSAWPFVSALARLDTHTPQPAVT